MRKKSTIRPEGFAAKVYEALKAAFSELISPVGRKHLKASDLPVSPGQVRRKHSNDSGCLGNPRVLLPPLLAPPLPPTRGRYPAGRGRCDRADGARYRPHLSARRGGGLHGHAGG